MTPKQKFFAGFLKSVYKLDGLEFEPCYGNSMQVKGLYNVQTPFGADQSRLPIAIWLDKGKKGLWSIKIKTYGSHIPMSKADEYIQRATVAFPGAEKIEVYRRTGSGWNREGGAPTLRILTYIRPWAKDKVKEVEPKVEKPKPVEKVPVTLREHIKAFLRKENIYDQFELNMQISLIRGIGLKLGLDEWLTRAFGLREPTSLIMGAFKWRETPEGFFFWKEVNSKWWKYCFEHKLVNDIDDEE